MAELTDVDHLADIWESSPDTRNDVQSLYPGLAHAIERVIDPELRAEQFFAKRSGDWVVGIPERMRQAIRNTPCPACFVGSPLKCITRSGSPSKFVHAERYLKRERWLNDE